MAAQQLRFGGEVCERIRCGVDTLADPFENTGAQLLREMAGDRSTTATVLAHALAQEGLRFLAGGMNPINLKRGTELGLAEIMAMARPCDASQEITHVASISANNDRSMGELLARAIEKVGREGAISVEDGSGLASELDVVEGMPFDRGDLSPCCIDDAERQNVRFEDAAIPPCEQELSTLQDLRQLLEEGVKAGPPLLVSAADIDSEALAKVGASTETELKARKIRLEDALRATHAAVEEPLRRILANAGEEPPVILPGVAAAGDAAHGSDAATHEFGDLLQMGVIDPAKATRLALQNAGSIAALMLTADGLIADAPRPPAAVSPVPGEIEAEF
jgi:chaperonin GroEL (HSP60 family)